MVPSTGSREQYGEALGGTRSTPGVGRKLEVTPALPDRKRVAAAGDACRASVTGKGRLPLSKQGTAI